MTQGGVKDIIILFSSVRRTFRLLLRNFKQMLWTISMILEASPNERPFETHIFSGEGPLSGFMQHGAREKYYFKLIRKKDLLVLVHLPEGFCFNKKQEICVRRGFFRRKVPVDATNFLISDES